jgi:hypothetical protein
MSLMLDIARVAAGVNILLLVGLLGIWVRNYRQMAAPILLGLILFGVLLLAENVIALYFYFTAPAMPSLAVQFMMILQVLEAIGVSVLFYVTWR